MFIWGVVVYKHFIRMLKQNMGIRQRCCGNCWAYLLIITRITSAICAFFFLLPRIFVIYSRSFEVYDENSYLYGVLVHHKDWYNAIISWGIWLLTSFSLFCLLTSFVLYLVFLRIYGLRLAKQHFGKFEKYIRRSMMEFMLGTSRRIIFEVPNYVEEAKENDIDWLEN